MTGRVVGTRLGLAFSTLVLSVTVVACTAPSGTTPSGTDSRPTGTTRPPASSTAPVSASQARHNDSDVFFAQNMVVHHQAAVEMARMVAVQGSSQQVKELAARIEAAQTPEITAMTGWLTAWGEPLDAGQVMPGMNDQPTSTDQPTPMDMPGPMGMMTGAQMKSLASASGPAFDRMFLRLMTGHHQGAIDMSEAEQAGGVNPRALALAESIRTSQAAEIRQMKRLLKTL